MDVAFVVVFRAKLATTIVVPRFSVDDECVPLQVAWIDTNRDVYLDDGLARFQLYMYQRSTHTFDYWHNGRFVDLYQWNGRRVCDSLYQCTCVCIYHVLNKKKHTKSFFFVYGVFQKKKT